MVQYFIYLGVGIVLIASLVIIVRAFQESIPWGIVCIVLNPFGGILFCITHLKKGIKPLAALMVGFTIVGSAVFADRMSKSGNAVSTLRVPGSR